MELRAVRGMNDILPEEARRWHQLETAFREHAAVHGYGELRTPLIEQTALFARQLGDTSDVVEKEMYSFERHGDALTVRPEGTASAARAYLEHSVHSKESMSRWFYIGPMFRGERPARGRYRQFHQAGCELYGEPGPLCDAEMIDFVAQFFRKIGVPDCRAHIGTIGSSEARHRYRDALVDYFRPMLGDLSEDSQRRLEKNPLRILDSKDKRDQGASTNAPRMVDYLTDDDRQHWEGLRRHLDVLEVDYVVDPALVRGLDYYTRTLFEFRTTAGELGSQNTICGGGRYDNMMQMMGGPSVPAIGFAMGIERLLLCANLPEPPRRPLVYLAPLFEGAISRALLLARDLRAHGVSAEVDGRARKLKPMLRRADSLGARICVILGDGELERGVVAMKDLLAHTQDEVAVGELVRVVADRLATPFLPATETADGPQRP